LTIALVVALVVITAIGTGLAYVVGRDAAIEGVATVDGTAPGGSASTTVIPSTDQGAATTAPGAATPGSASGTAGPVTVTLSPSAEAAPQARDITDLIVRYFNSINRHDYDAWLTTVTTAQARRDRDSWTTDYSTTQDSDIYISDINQGEPLTVRMQFVSHQDVAFAPPQLPAECVRWDVTYEILDEGVGLRVGTSAKAPAMAAC
jgi:hypothetical protein